jgi:hypothetical protein
VVEINWELTWHEAEEHGLVELYEEQEREKAAKRSSRVPCGRCGGPGAEWRGDLQRHYVCDACAKRVAS